MNDINTNLIKSSIRTIPDYPKPGIQFRDITTLLESPDALKETIKAIVSRYESENIQWVAGIEARGFIFGTVAAYELGAGFIPVRKKGKLPGTTIHECYELEYGKDCVEIHTDVIQKGDRVLIIDDLIATGGTAEAAVKLIRKVGGEVIESCFVIDLPDLGGCKRLENIDCPTFALCEFEGD
jgi:adenine phosphoribosyltransferase